MQQVQGFRKLATNTSDGYAAPATQRRLPRSVTNVPSDTRRTRRKSVWASLVCAATHWFIRRNAASTPIATQLALRFKCLRPFNQAGISRRHNAHWLLAAFARWFLGSDILFKDAARLPPRLVPSLLHKSIIVERIQGSLHSLSLLLLARVHHF